MDPLRRAAEAIHEACATWRYRPLPKSRRDEFHAIYNEALNGFDRPEHRPCVLKGGTLMATDYVRVVVGDYGPWVEFEREQITVPLPLMPFQEWRGDKAYVERRGLNIKYIARHINGVMVYDQLGPVKYADYKPGMLYISTLDFERVQL